MLEMWVRSLGQEDPLEKGMATHSRILAWKIPWMEETARLQSMGSQWLGRDLVTEHALKGQCLRTQGKDSFDLAERLWAGLRISPRREIMALWPERRLWLLDVQKPTELPHSKSCSSCSQHTLQVYSSKPSLPFWFPGLYLITCTLAAAAAALQLSPASSPSPPSAARTHPQKHIPGDPPRHKTLVAPN